jgi:hypothetical protein
MNSYISSGFTCIDISGMALEFQPDSLHISRTANSFYLKYRNSRKEYFQEVPDEVRLSIRNDYLEFLNRQTKYSNVFDLDSHVEKYMDLYNASKENLNSICS